MEKIYFSEAALVMGGYNETGCKAAQALADAYQRDGASNEQWDDWSKFYDENCL